MGTLPLACFMFLPSSEIVRNGLVGHSRSLQNLLDNGLRKIAACRKDHLQATVGAYDERAEVVVECGAITLERHIRQACELLNLLRGTSQKAPMHWIVV